jgi:predicted lipoprotein with Yx(FWY)xxD motif
VLAATATVQIAEHPEFGEILTDANGMTLYIFLRDEPGVSNCTGMCAQNWPPLTVESEDALFAPEGLVGELGLITREDGSLQVTYNGMPLYLWVNDQEPGDTTGHNVNEVWLTATVEPLEEESAMPSGGSGY